MTAHERSGWRDENISRRHRIWGQDVPGVDLDWPYLEYDRAKPIAIIDYKHWRAPIPDTSGASYRAMLALSAAAGIPFFAVFYWPEEDSPHYPWAIRVLPVGDDAMRIVEKSANYVPHDDIPHMDLTELEYVSMLYWLRGRKLDLSLATQLHGEKPPPLFLEADEIPF